MRFKPILLIMVILSASFLVHFPINTQVSAQQNYTIDSIIVKPPSNRITSSRPLMSFVEGIHAWTPYSITGSSTSFTLKIVKEGCAEVSFNITVPSTSSTKAFLPTSALYTSQIYLAFSVSSLTYYFTSISYTISGCNINISTTNPTWNNTTDVFLIGTSPPIWLSDRVYLLESAIWNYDNQTKVTNLPNSIVVSQSAYIRLDSKILAFGFSGNSNLYYCTITFSFSVTCLSSETIYSGSPRIIGYIYYQDIGLVYLHIQHSSNPILYDIVIINTNTSTITRAISNISSPLFFGFYGTSYNYTLRPYNVDVFVPLQNLNGTTSVVIYFGSDSFKYYKTTSLAYNELQYPIGDLTQNPYYHMLVLPNNAFSNNMVNIFDQNLNLVGSFNLSGLQVPTYYPLLKFPSGIKYIQVYNTNTNQSIIFSKANSFTPATNISYLYDPFQTTVVMTPITFSRLDTDTNYYYVEVVQNRQYKNSLQYYAKIIDQTSQVTLALRQAQCSYLILHEINKSTLQESTMSFMVCEDGISKTIEVPNTVNFVYAHDVIFKIHKTSNNDFNISISSNKDINSEVKVIVCDVIDRAVYDFENSTNEGVKITPTDVTITYPALSSNERAMKVYKNASGTYEYDFPLIKINKNATNNVYVEFSPQDIGGDTKVYTLQFLLRQYNSAKQVISDLTLLSQSDYNGFNTRTYGSYTAYYRSLTVPTLDTNTEYVQLVLRFTTSTAAFYNHIILVYIDTNVNQRLCHNYVVLPSMTANTIYTIEDNVRSILDKEIIIQYNNHLYSNTFYVTDKSSYSSNSNVASTFTIKIKSVFDEFSTKLVGNTDMSIALFLAFMSMMFFSTVITRNIAVMYAIFILIVSITAYIYSTEILSMPALIILAFMAVALAIYYRYR